MNTYFFILIVYFSDRTEGSAQSAELHKASLRK
jgi:hypothetical protein